MKRTLLRGLRWLDNRMQGLRRSLLPSELVVFEDVTRHWLVSALGVASELGLASKVPARGSISLEELAREVNLDCLCLRRLLRMLVSHGYFELDKSGVRHTPLSRALKRGRAGSFLALQTQQWYRSCFGSERVVQAWSQQKVPFDSGAGESFFEFLSGEPAKEELFAEAMAEITRFCGPHIAEAFDFSAEARVLDLGGGNGQLVSILAEFFPSTQFMTLDSHSNENSQSLRGNFFEAIPSGFDHYLLKNILHDWNDERVLKILQNATLASGPDSKLHIIELLLPDRDGYSLESASDFGVDWNVFCTLGGQERSESEYSALLERAGWKLTKVAPTATPLWVLTASPQIS